MKINCEFAENFIQIISHFNIKGEIVEVTQLGSGHIHDTFRLKNVDHNYPDYVLQRINHNVFRNVPALSENITKVTTHLKNKLALISGANPDKEVLTVIPTSSGNYWYEDEENNFWRLFIFLKNTKSYDIVETKNQAYEGGKAYGNFITLLNDMDVSILHETIPHFHDVEDRLKNLYSSIMLNPKRRVEHVKEELSFVKTREYDMATVQRWGNEGKIPLIMYCWTNLIKPSVLLIWILLCQDLWLMTLAMLSGL